MTSKELLSHKSLVDVFFIILLWLKLLQQGGKRKEKLLVPLFVWLALDTIIIIF